MISIEEAKTSLDKIISKARVDMYKPIQVAEVLYQARVVQPELDLLNIETFRRKSIQWRDAVTRRLYGKVSISSQKYQDNIWDKNAIPPIILAVLDKANKQTNGAVEKYIYLKFQEKQKTVASLITFIADSTPNDFELAKLFSNFRIIAGLRRSIDKAYEIVVYSILETIITSLEATVTVAVPIAKNELLAEFSDLAGVLLGPSMTKNQVSLPAHVYRVGVTNAADRGLDMWANFGVVIQVKHLTLDPKLAQAITDQVESDNIIIVCRDAEKKTIETLMSQTGWIRRVRGIITEKELIQWYELCLRGKFASELGFILLERLEKEFRKEFRSAGDVVLTFLEERGYLQINSPDLWKE